MWRALLYSWEKIVKYETFYFSFCPSRKERDMLADYPALFSVRLSGCWIQQTVFSHPIYFLCLSILLLPNLFQSSSPACHEHSRNDPEPCGLWSSCQETPVCYVVLQSNALQVPACVSSMEYRMRAMQTSPLPHQCLAYKKALHCLCRAWSLRSVLEWGNTAGALLGVFVLLCFNSASEMSQGKFWRPLEGEDETPEVIWV